MKVEIVDPTRYPDWDEFLFSVPGASFFHTSAWARVLSESYNYSPLYFTVFENGNLCALVPLMEVKSTLTGKRGVSLPFTDYCEPIVGGGVQFQDLLNHIIDYGKQQSWKYIELRGGCSLIPRVPILATHLVHMLDLTKGEDKIFSSLRDSTRRNIKKAKTQNVKVKISNDAEAIGGFYRLNCLTRKDHGLPPQPHRFFEKIFEHILSKGLGFVTLASFNGHDIAGAVFFHFGDKGIYKYGASEKKFQGLRGNNLAIWEGIRWFCNNGIKNISFGRTAPENQGLRQFKAGWRTEENILPYFKYNLRKMKFAHKQAINPAFSTRVFQRLPIPVLNLAGTLLYRHMG